MKITLSKNQWKMAGIKAGWIPVTSMVDPIKVEEEELINEVIKSPRNFRMMPLALRNDPNVLQRLKLAWLSRIRDGERIYDNLPENFKKDPDISRLVRNRWENPSPQNTYPKYSYR